MERSILYVTNYYRDDVIRQRHSEPFISQAGQNKSQYILDVLEYGKNRVTVWSNAWTGSRTFRFYKGFASACQENLYYSSIFGAPVLNSLSCYLSSRRFLKKYMKEQKLDALIFYNMRLENSLLALYAKKHYNLPIILQYEDGLTTDAHISKIKRLVYGSMEKKVLKKLDGAFLVNSKIKVPCPAVVIRGAMREGAKNAPFPPVEGTPQLLFSSTLDEQRGAYVLLEALKHTDAEFCLTITGRGDAGKAICSCGDKRVRYLGYLDYETYKQELASADICINAQLANHEFADFSFPSKIFEYLSAGKLVISSDMADVEEGLGDAVLVYHNDSPRELAACIERAIAVKKEPAANRQYGAAIRAIVEENSMQRVAEKVNCLLDKITVS
jgi:glycosyltransferase involved in cell wall biosynthesis